VFDELGDREMARPPVPSHGGKKLREQARLPDSRLTADERDRAAALREPAPRGEQRSQLLGTPDEGGTGERFDDHGFTFAAAARGC